MNNRERAQKNTSSTAPVVKSLIDIVREMPAIPIKKPNRGFTQLATASKHIRSVISNGYYRYSIKAAIPFLSVVIVYAIGTPAIAHWPEYSSIRTIADFIAQCFRILFVITLFVFPIFGWAGIPLLAYTVYGIRREQIVERRVVLIFISILHGAVTVYMALWWITGQYSQLFHRTIN